MLNRGRLNIGKLNPGALLTRRAPTGPTLQDLFSGGEDGGYWLPGVDNFTDAGTTPAGVDDAVYQANDQSGNGNHATQTSAAARFALKQDGNGKYYWLADMVDDFLFVNFALLNATPHTYFCAYEHADANNIVLLGKSTAVNPWVGVGEDGSSSTGISAFVTQNQLRIDAVTSSATTRGQQYDLMTAGSVAVSKITPTNTDFTNFRFGVFSAGGFHLAEKIYAFGVIDRHLTDAEILSVESILAGLRGVSL